ncbi:MAG: zf-HC2 domain-containing protein, partial [Candidatus Angelobacter sp.]
MKHQQQNPEEAMKQAAAEMRADQPTPENLFAAGERVWKSLDQRVAQGAQMPGIEGCTDIRKVLPEYHAGRLSESRVLLLEAHLHECAACRQQAETGKQTPVLQPWTQALPRMGAGGFRWAVAAVALVAAGLSVYFLQAKFFAGPVGMRASVVSMDGALYRVGFSGEQPLHRGDEISEGDKVRTAGGSRAMLRLRDGSLVEVNERAQLGVSMS